MEKHTVAKEYKTSFMKCATASWRHHDHRPEVYNPFATDAGGADATRGAAPTGESA